MVNHAQNYEDNKLNTNHFSDIPSHLPLLSSTSHHPERISQHSQTLYGRGRQSCSGMVVPHTSKQFCPHHL